MFHLMYVDDLLTLMFNKFKKCILNNIIIDRGIYKKIPPFHDEYRNCIQKWEFKQKKKEQKKTLMRKFSDTTKGKKTDGKKSKKAKKKEEKLKKKTISALLHLCKCYFELITISEKISELYYEL